MPKTTESTGPQILTPAHLLDIAEQALSQCPKGDLARTAATLAMAMLIQEINNKIPERPT